MKRKSIAAAVSLFPATALAHGEQVLLLPLGHICFLVLGGIFALLCARHGLFAYAARSVIAGVLSVFALWTFPGSLFSPIGSSELGLFLVGLLIPALVAFLAFIVQLVVWPPRPRRA